MFSEAQRERGSLFSSTPPLPPCASGYLIPLFLYLSSGLGGPLRENRGPVNRLLRAAPTQP